MTFATVLVLMFGPFGDTKNAADIHGSNFSGNGKISFTDKRQPVETSDSLISKENSLPQTSSKNSPLAIIIGIAIVSIICTIHRYRIITLIEDF